MVESDSVILSNLSLNIWSRIVEVDYSREFKNGKSVIGSCPLLILTKKEIFALISWLIGTWERYGNAPFVGSSL